MVYRHNEELIKKLQNEKEAEAFFYKTLEECKKMDKKQAREHLIETMKILRKAQGSWVCDNWFGNFFYKIISSIIFKLRLERYRDADQRNQNR